MARPVFRDQSVLIEARVWAVLCRHWDMHDSSSHLQHANWATCRLIVASAFFELTGFTGDAKYADAAMHILNSVSGGDAPGPGPYLGGAETAAVTKGNGHDCGDPDCTIIEADCKDAAPSSLAWSRLSTPTDFFSSHSRPSLPPLALAQTTLWRRSAASGRSNHSPPYHPRPEQKNCACPSTVLLTHY